MTSDRWRVVMLLPWHLAVGGIHQAASKHSVLELNVLVAKLKDLNDCDKGRFVMAESLHLPNSSFFGMFLVCNGQDLRKVVHGRKTSEPTKGEGQLTLLHASKDWVMLSDPIRELIAQIAEKKPTVVPIEKFTRHMWMLL